MDSGDASMQVAGDVTTVPSLSAEQLVELLALLPGADTVELKASVSDSTRRSVVRSLGMDPLDAQIRQVAFFDTPDLTLSDLGLVIRARRIQGKSGDSVIKLRPVVPAHPTPALRKAPGFGVEVDAMPGGFVCSARLKASVKDKVLKQVVQGDLAVSKAFTKAQRALFAEHAPAGLELDELMVLGPLNILKLKFSHPDYPRPMVVELWLYPGGSQLLELSAKTLPDEAFAAAAETKAFVATHGVDLGAPQQTKTRTALDFFVSEMAGSKTDA